MNNTIQKAALLKANELYLQLDDHGGLRHKHNDIGYIYKALIEFLETHQQDPRTNGRLDENNRVRLSDNIIKSLELHNGDKVFFSLNCQSLKWEIGTDGNIDLDNIYFFDQFSRVKLPPTLVQGLGFKEGDRVFFVQNVDSAWEVHREWKG